MKRSADGTYTEVFWQDAIRAIAAKCTSTPSEAISAIIGEFADVEAITALKDFMNRLNSDSFEVRTSVKSIKNICGDFLF